MRAPRRAKAIIDSLLEKKAVTQEAINWLTYATDPFHDSPLPPSGFPDINTNASLVQAFTYTTNISAPAATGSNPWEAHVFFVPVSAFIQANGTSSLNAFAYNPLTMQITTPSTANMTSLLAGYNVLTGPIGMDWSVANVNIGLATNAVGFPTNVSGGLFRLIATGVEVVNTTAPLYKGGSCTCYRAPSHNMLMQANVVASTNPTPYLFNTFDLPPSSQSSAQLYPSARTWEAAEGYYGIGTITDVNLPFQSAVNCTPLGIKPAAQSALVSGTTQPIWTYSPTLGASGPIPLTTSRVLPFDTHGCVFSGLTPQSTLQITTRYVVERIPSTTEPDLLVLTRPPTPYDPLVQEIYARTVAELPVGCMVKENPLGEWWNDVLQTVAEYAPSVGKVFGPLGQALGAGIGSGAQMWLDSRKTADPAPKGNVMGQKKQKPKPRNPQQQPRQARTINAGNKAKKKKQKQVTVQQLEQALANLS